MIAHDAFKKTRAHLWWLNHPRLARKGNTTDGVSVPNCCGFFRYPLFKGTIQHSHNGQDLQDCDGASRRVHLEPGEPVLRLVRRRAQRERSVHSQHR